MTTDRQYTTRIIHLAAANCVLSCITVVASLTTMTIILTR